MAKSWAVHLSPNQPPVWQYSTYTGMLRRLDKLEETGGVLRAYVHEVYRDQWQVVEFNRDKTTIDCRYVTKQQLREISSERIERTTKLAGGVQSQQIAKRGW